MRALLIQSHPSPESFTAAIGTLTERVLREGGAAVRRFDLYAEDFDPVLSREGWEGYHDDRARAPVARHVEALRWADALVFVYPTWWYGLPAMLKGWLERALLPDVAFVLPEDGPIRPALTHIRQLSVFTTCGASPWLTWALGAPGAGRSCAGCARSARRPAGRITRRTTGWIPRPPKAGRGIWRGWRPSVGGCWPTGGATCRSRRGGPPMPEVRLLPLDRPRIPEEGAAAPLRGPAARGGAGRDVRSRSAPLAAGAASLAERLIATHAQRRS